MHHNAGGTFVLFEVGHDEKMLQLGDLVLYDYKNPLIARHYTCQKLPEEEDIGSTRMSKFSVFHKHGPQTGIELEAASFIKLGATLDQEAGQLVIAESAERIVLRNPSAYLRDVVLADKSASEALTIWLSAGSTERILKFKWARRPKIWMMTGMYFFEKAKVVNVRSSKIGGEFGVSSEIIAALAAAPVGGSVSHTLSNSVEVSMEVPDRKVWAAQYQLLNARYVDPAAAADVKILSTLTLYPDITSRGVLRNSDSSGRVSAVVGAFDEAESTTSDYAESDVTAEAAQEAEYLQLLEKTVASYEKELKDDDSDDEE